MHTTVITIKVEILPELLIWVYIQKRNSISNNTELKPNYLVHNSTFIVNK